MKFGTTFLFVTDLHGRIYIDQLTWCKVPVQPLKGVISKQLSLILKISVSVGQPRKQRLSNLQIQHCVAPPSQFPFNSLTFCLFPLSSFFSSSLCNIWQNSGIEKAFLFDVVSKIYIATDSSPVDMQSYELCCDMIDVVIDVSCIYGWEFVF